MSVTGGRSVVSRGSEKTPGTNNSKGLTLKERADAAVVKVADADGRTDKEKMRAALETNNEAVRAALNKLTPHDIFAIFDEDESGLVGFEEFRKMLPYLNINISDAKALRYFKMCDADNSGAIDIDEFQAALFACDPVCRSLNALIAFISECANFSGSPHLVLYRQTATL